MRPSVGKVSSFHNAQPAGRAACDPIECDHTTWIDRRRVISHSSKLPPSKVYHLPSYDVCLCFELSFIRSSQHGFLWLQRSHEIQTMRTPQAQNVVSTPEFAQWVLIHSN